MADNDALITQFMDVTGVQRDRAEFFLQAANFQLDVALSSFYEESADVPAAASDSSDDEVLSGSKETASSKKRSYGNQNFATMSSVREPEKEGDEKGQAFYAGGSEHSGLQVLGPPKKNPIKDMVSEVFRQAQSGNMEQFESSHDGDSPSFRSFTGTGYRLGQSEDDSVPVASGSKNKKPQEETVTVKVYRQGFTVDDGELRSYEDPNNREFFESITRNEIPAELRKQGKAMVHVNVENHLSDDFVKKTPKFKAFTGSGHTLGSPAPPTVEEITTNAATVAAIDPKATNAENEAKASSNLKVNQEQPTTMLSIRLTDGSRLSGRFNLTHTIQDIRQYIVTARPEYTGRNYILLTTFPNKELTNPEDTIQQAGLQNAAILQRLK
ncbi:NSFL1 cofactor p47-like [Chironomus tepperi]|uniref:NSFL1 cofactor p47-like n=1 Tax=Chironomus tepperi TaxID=113505 RepID=UPI00391F97A3